MFVKKRLFSFLLLIGLLTITYRTSFSSDFGWHLRTGATIFQTQQIPSTDTYSYTFFGTPYIYHSWLAEVLIYLFYSIGSQWGVSLLYSLLLGTGVFLIVKDKKLTLFEILLFFSLVFSLLQMIGFRTQTFSFFFLSLTYYLTLPERLTKTKKPFLWISCLIPIFILWANTHPGFLLGLVFAGYNLVVWSLTQRKSFKTLVYSIFLLLIAFVGTLVNPYGYHLHEFLIKMLTNSSASKYIFDWIPFLELPSLELKYKLFVIMLFLIVMVTPSKRVFDKWLFLIVFLFMLQSTRYTMPFSLLLFILFPETLRWLSLWLQRQNSLYKKLMSGLLWTLIFAMGVNFSLTAQATYCANSNPVCLEEKAPSDFKYPYQAVDYIRNNEVPNNIFNDFNWGGYLIWQLPERKFFIDGRMDNFFYPDGTSFLETFVSVVRADDGWDKTLNRYQINTILLRPNFPLIEKLRQDKNWQVVFENETSIILVRDETETIQ